MPQGDRAAAPARRAGGQDVVGHHDLHGRRAADPGEGGDRGDADRDHRGQGARAVHGAEHDGQEQGREGEDQVVDAHDQFGEPAARGHPGDQAERGADHGGDADGDDPDVERGARADHELAQCVAAELVGAEQVAVAGGLELAGRIDQGGVVRGPEERDQCGEHDESDQ